MLFADPVERSGRSEAVESTERVGAIEGEPLRATKLVPETFEGDGARNVPLVPQDRHHLAVDASPAATAGGAGEELGEGDLEADGIGAPSTMNRDKVSSASRSM